MPSRIGALAGRYILTRLLGEDAAVSTFEGRDGALDQPVLIKLLPKALATDPARQERLQRLGERLAALDHPNLLSVIETGLEEGVPYLIAHGVAASPLAERMGRALDVEQAASIISQVGEALIHAYSQGLTHGNLSPRNVLLAAGDQVLLSEVGLESVLETPWEKVQEELASYLAPERIQGWLSDARTDVYALGAMLFEMLTGLQLDEPLAQALPWLREAVPGLAPDLEPVLTRALAPDPDARYATVGEFMADLRPILVRYLQPVEAPPVAETALPPVLALDEAPSPPSVPPSIPVTLALEGVPVIPMPQPPPVPTFDWDAFARQMTTVPLPEPPPPPEPPPLPKITLQGIEFPTVPSVLFEEPAPIVEDARSDETPLPEPPGRSPVPASKVKDPLAPARPSARPVQRARQPEKAVKRPVQPASPADRLASVRETVTAAAPGVGRLARVVLVAAVILLLLTLSCCCWLLLASDLSDTAATPAAYAPPLDAVRCASWMLLGEGRHHGLDADPLRAGLLSFQPDHSPSPAERWIVIHREQGAKVGRWSPLSRRQEPQTDLTKRPFVTIIVTI